MQVNPSGIFGAFRRGLIFILGFFVVLFSGTLNAQEEPTPAAPNTVLHSAHSFWSLSAEAQKIDHPIETVFTVLHYDPDWAVLWILEEGIPVFVTTSQPPLPIAQGDIVHISGVISSTQGLRANPEAVVIKGQAKLPPPFDASLDLKSPKDLDQKFVRLTGMVDLVRKADINHNSFGLIVRGVPVMVHVRSKNTPPAIGAVLQVTGFLALEPNEHGPPFINVWLNDDSAIIAKGWAQKNENFILPLTSIEKIVEQDKTKPLHIRGTAKLQLPGQGIWIFDQTGEAFVGTPQRQIIMPGTVVEAFGFPSTLGNKPGLGGDTLVFDLADFRPTALADDHVNPKRVINSAGDIYSIDAVDRQDDLHFDAVFQVLFYDPYWKTLWGQDSTSRFFLQPGQDPLAIKSGQLVHIRGLFSDPKGLRAEAKDITVLENHPKAIAPDETANVNDTARLNGYFVQLTGYVEKQTTIDQWHLGLQLIVGDKKINPIVLVENEDSAFVTNFQGAICSIQGVYNRNNPDALREESVALMVPSISSIHQLYWLRSDPRFALPLVTAAEFTSLRPDQIIHISGHVVSTVPGQYIDIRDSSGQIRIYTLQAEVPSNGEYIEAIGLPSSNGITHSLKQGLYIRSAEAIQGKAAATTNQALRLVGQISSLSSLEAAKRYPVVLKVHTSWSHPTSKVFFAEDGSGGLRFHLQDPNLRPPEIGTVIELFGETDNIDQLPSVKVSMLRVLNSQVLAEPLPLTLDQARAGMAENSTIELRGLFRSYSTRGAYHYLDFLTNSGGFHAVMPSTVQVEGLLGSILYIHGVSSLEASGLRTPELTLYCSSPDQLTKPLPRPDDLNAMPSISMAALALNPPKPRDEQWIRTFGTLSYHRLGNYLYIQEGRTSLRVYTTQADQLRPGDRLDVIGMPCWLGNRLVLREAIARKNRSGSEPTPINLAPPFHPLSELDNDLVTVRGTLVSTLNTAGRATLTLLNDGHFFSCELDDVKQLLSRLNLPHESTLQITGIYHLNTSDDRPSSFSLELRSIDDIQLLSSPPWLNAKRALTIAGTLALIILGGLAWILQLRKTVSKQTVTIRKQMEKESQLTADLERATRLESLGMLAGGIAHDFNNMLTIIVGNLSLARMEDGVEAVAGDFLKEAERGAMRARNLTQQLLTFARGGNPIRKSENLIEILKEEAEDAVNNDQLKLHFKIADALPEAYLDRAQFSQVVLNIVNNSIQASARALRINVNLQTIAEHNAFGLNAGNYLHLIFTDDGPGIAPSDLGKVFDPYFTTKKGHRGLGLSLVRSILGKHEGYVSINSEPGKGAAVSLWLPAAKQNSLLNAAKGSAADTKQESFGPTDKAGAHILLMDDEAPIRLMVSALLRKLGHTVTLAAEGATAIKQYKAAMESGRRFDLVILDLSVPNGMGGMETIEQLRILDPKVCAIVSSGYSNDPIMADHRHFGFAAMVPKPYQITELTTAVQALLAKAPEA